MTNPFSAEFWKQYNARKAHFFLRHPVAQFIFYWCLLFTVFYVGDAFLLSDVPSRYPVSIQVLGKLLGSCIVTIFCVPIQRRRWKQTFTRSPDV
jgi:hypothetical protein